MLKHAVATCFAVAHWGSRPARLAIRCGGLSPRHRRCTIRHVEDVAAPSFVDIGRKYRGKPRTLRAFIIAPVHPMREQRFLRRDLDDIIAYIRSRGPTK